jgi:hypothetical protein
MWIRGGYSFVAILMGAAWYAVLLPFGDGLPLGGRYGIANLSAMCLASLTVASFLRPTIVSAKDERLRVLAIALPSILAFVFGVYAVLLQQIMTAVEGETSLKGGILLLPFYCVTCGAWMLLPITVPMGILSLWLLQITAGRREPDQTVPDDLSRGTD